MSSEQTKHSLRRKAEASAWNSGNIKKFKSLQHKTFADESPKHKALEKAKHQGKVHKFDNPAWLKKMDIRQGKLDDEQERKDNSK